MFKKKGISNKIKKLTNNKCCCVLLVSVIIIATATGCGKSSKQPVQNTPKQTTQKPQSATKYKVGEVGPCGVVMTESLIQYLSEAEKNPIKTKSEAENITKEVYTDVTNQDGKTMAEKDMMTKLYQAQIYYDKNMNSQYSSLNSLLIEEFGGRINKTRGVSGAAERMNNIRNMYKMITS
jgi:hypothetical protein